MYIRSIANKIKVHTSPKLWGIVRRGWYIILNGVHSVGSYARTIGPYVQTRDYCGLTLYYNRGSSIMDRLAAEPVFEERMCISIEQELKKKGAHPIFVDVGANLGLIFAHVVSKVPDVHVFAFEPGPRQRALIEMTVNKNDLGRNVTIYSDCLGKALGKEIFYTHAPQYIANDGLIDTRRVRGARAIEVHVTTLDSWWASRHFPKVAVIKIDTEGAELWILQGAVKMLAETSPVLYLEIEPKNLRVYPYDHFGILAFLHETHYKLLTLDGIEITKENFPDHIGVEDTYVARPVNYIG